MKGTAEANASAILVYWCVRSGRRSGHGAAGTMATTAGQHGSNFRSYWLLKLKARTDPRVHQRNSLVRSEDLMPSTRKGSDYAKRAAASASPLR